MMLLLIDSCKSNRSESREMDRAIESTGLGIGGFEISCTHAPHMRTVYNVAPPQQAPPVEVKFVPFLIDSLSPLSVSSCIRSSAQPDVISTKSPHNDSSDKSVFIMHMIEVSAEEVIARYLCSSSPAPATWCPCTTFCLRILATSCASMILC
jgi:hypothetical protein